MVPSGCTLTYPSPLLHEKEEVDLLCCNSISWPNLSPFLEPQNMSFDVSEPHNIGRAMDSEALNLYSVWSGM